VLPVLPASDGYKVSSIKSDGLVRYI